jgi:hypothetical protein
VPMNQKLMILRYVQVLQINKKTFRGFPQVP